jgi:RHS repeat-associated protein
VFIEERNNVWNTPYLFNSKELDEETGLYYYGARYYNPRESIFLSVDPLVEKTGTPYQYCYQNPVKFVDPDGMTPNDIIFGNISQAAKDKIVSDLSQLTGLSLSVSDNGTLSYANQSSYSGGSAMAREVLMGAIDDHHSTYNINSDNSIGTSIHQEARVSGSVVHDNQRYAITRAFGMNVNTNGMEANIAGTSQSLNPLTMGYGMSVLHEVNHKFNNLTDGIGNFDTSGIYGMLGDNVNFMNKIRSELDASGDFRLPFGQRQSYVGDQVGDTLFFPFSKEAYNKGVSGVDAEKDLFIKTKIK